MPPHRHIPQQIVQMLDGNGAKGHTTEGTISTTNPPGTDQHPLFAALANQWLRDRQTTCGMIPQKLEILTVGNIV